MELQRIQNQINLLQKAYTTLETACNKTNLSLSHMYSEHIAHKDIHIIKEHHTLIQKYISNLQNNI